jgi:hypothetical protein
MQRRSHIILLSLLALGGAGAPGAARADIVNYSHTWDDTEPSGSLRLFRNGIPSVAPTPKPFPGTFANIPTFFNTLLLSVAPGSVVNVITVLNNENSFYALYDTSIDPSNLATNYLGDAGTSDTGIAFSIVAPASGQVLLVAMTVGGNLAIGNATSAEITFTPAGTAVPEPSSIALGGLGVACLAAVRWNRRRVRADVQR